MAQDSYPSGSRDGGSGVGVITDIEGEALVQAFYPTGILGLPTDPYPVYSDGTGTRAAHFRAGSSGLVRGCIYLEGTTDTTISCAANSTGADRYDLAVWRLDRSIDNAVRAAIVTGGSSTAGPAATQTDTSNDSGVWEYPLGVFKIPNGASSIAASALTKKLGYWIARPGYITSTGAGRPPAVKGQTIYEYESGLYAVGNGTAYDALNSESGYIPLTSVTKFDITDGSYVQQVGRMVRMHLQVTRTSGTLAPSTAAVIAKMPPALAPKDHIVRFMSYLNGDFDVLCNVGNDGTVNLQAYSQTSIGADDVVSCSDVVWFL
jgi:hypothetical protein